MGVAVGMLVGMSVGGKEVGRLVGRLVGTSVGGSVVGTSVGSSVGLSVGGKDVGWSEGKRVGQLVGGSDVGVTVGVLLSSLSSRDTSQPISAPTTNEESPINDDDEELPLDNSTDFQYLQEQLIRWNISDESAVFRTISPQYRALDWLVHMDPARLDVRDTDHSILIERYVFALRRSKIR